jgi:drug/metabolite transporter (DMT)-like permease
VDHGFRFPFALTAMGQGASVLLALAASLLGFAPLRPPPSAEVAITKLLPVAASFAASLFLGNVAYLGLSVAFINMLKAATPLVTLAVGLALRLEAMSKLTLLSTALIAFGTAVATASEAGTTHFHWLSFLAFAGSVVFEGVRVVMTEKLLGQSRYNVMEALVYLGPFTTAFLAAGAFAFEWDQGLSTTGWALLRSRAGDFATATLISFLVNLFCYLAIKHVSATSFKVAGAHGRYRGAPCWAAVTVTMALSTRSSALLVYSTRWLRGTLPCAGCLKNVLVVWGGILQGDVVTSRELQGYGISLAGFVLFSAARYRRPAGAGHSGDSNGRGPPKKR